MTRLLSGLNIKDFRLRKISFHILNFKTLYVLSAFISSSKYNLVAVDANLTKESSCLYGTEQTEELVFVITVNYDR